MVDAGGRRDSVRPAVVIARVTVIAGVVLLGWLMRGDALAWRAAERTMARLRPQVSGYTVADAWDIPAWWVWGWAAVLVVLAIWPYLRRRRWVQVLAYALTGTVLGALAGLVVAARHLLVHADSVADAYRLPTTEAFNALYFGGLPWWENLAYGWCGASLVVGSLVVCAAARSAANSSVRRSSV